MIGINFKGRTTEGMGASVGDRSAGVEPQTNWNDAGSGTFTSLLDDTGVSTSISVSPNNGGSAYNSYVLISSDNGNNYLMRGYLYQTAEPMTVTVTGLGTDFTTHGYDLIVYFDGPNGENKGDWVTEYALSSGESIYGKDAEDTQDWGGTFVQAFGTSINDATAGNYVRFTGLTVDSLTLTATPDSGDAPINGLQIVAVPEPTALVLLGLGLAATLARRRQTRPG